MNLFVSAVKLNSRSFRWVKAIAPAASESSIVRRQRQKSVKLCQKF
ncbi:MULTISPECIES: hypothetical protein [unclassified Microcoleus]|nr:MULTISPECIES: hypothetical protein [unclassified Microcoleus]